MTRALSVFAAAFVAALALGGSAAAQTFVVVPVSLPSAETPNAPGAITSPFPLSRPPTQPATLSYEELVGLWQRAGAAYGVPWQVLGAINKVESNFGANMGPSSAGAVGWMQFMPSTWERWGTDADGDRVADPWDPEDAVFAAARYLAAAGAATDISRAVFAYNHAQWYVDEVLELAAMLDGASGYGGAFAAVPRADAVRIADLDERLAAARRRVARARRAVPVAELEVERIQQELLEAETRAGDPSLTTDQFAELEARIAALHTDEELARAAVERRSAELDYAVSALDGLRSEAASVTSLSPSAASFLSGVVGSGEYVFPVGGGAAVVSVAHTHHDYPAADIAAPEGSSVFALASAIVTEAYPDGEGNCGIGFKVVTESGAVWVYCHLAYLEPDVTPGAALSAGSAVGLVGETGNATGPHLHLALDPADRYPQEEAWFSSLAGTAFSWQDAPTPQPRPAAQARSRRPHRVFSVVATPQPSVVRFTR
jgi:murein DD-endopeptidase MepM/ murein hydrolase activator NlpD